MVSAGLARKAAAFGASAAVLATLSAGLVAGPAQAATAGKAPKVSVSAPKATPGKFEGSCPAKVDFSAKIKVPVKGKTELAYRWLHGDGSKSKVHTVKLKGKGVKTVTVKQSITFDEDVKGWEAIQILGPKKVTSKKGYFSVSCQEPLKEVRTHLDVSVKARAWATPSSYAGRCTPGNKIGFVGLIEADRPTWVRYRWLLNGDAVDYGKVKVHDARKVGFAFSPRHSERGWAQLQILGPDGSYSNRAGYKVWCKDYTPHKPEGHGTKVSASASVSVDDNCAVKASGFVSATGAGKVSYTWRVNGSPIGGGEVYFGRGGGTKSVNGVATTVSGEAVKGGTVTLSVTGPNNSSSDSESYRSCGVTTQVEKPAETLKVEATPTPSASTPAA